MIDLFHHGFLDLLVRRRFVVLRAHHDGVHALGLVVFVLDGDLGLAVGAQPLQRAVLADVRKPKRQLVRQVDRERHELLGLVDGITEHDALVARALFLLVMDALPGGHALGDIGRLAIQRHHHAAGLVIEPFVRANRNRSV